MPDAAAGVGGVAVVAGNDVAVEVHNGLSGSCAAVHADVVAVGELLRYPLVQNRLFDQLSDFVNQLRQRALFIIVQGEVIRHFALAHNQQMARTHRKTIFQCIEMLIFEESLRYGFFAEYTHDRSFS